MQQLEAHEVPLHKIFCSDYDFHIPDYQRPYAWEVEQATQLLTDLEEALDRDGDEPYFLGSVVLVKSKESAYADVIDGQQRLTTLTILLAVLRDLTDDAELRANLEEMIAEPGNKLRGLSPSPRLTLRSRDTDFFRTHVQKADSIPKLLELPEKSLETGAQRAVQANARALHAALERWSEERRLALSTMLSTRTYLVVVSTPSLESAHRIFSVMNSRGLDLTAADIFKSQIIGDLDPSVSEKYAEKWENAEEALGRDEFADLFLHLRTIFSGRRAEVELLKEFPEQVLSRYLPDRADVFVDDVLVPYADAYIQIRDHNYAASEGAEKVNAWFKRLEQLDNSDWRPPALWAVHKHGDDPHWLDQFFRALERLAASMLVRRIYATSRARRYADLLRELTAGKGLDARPFELSDAEKAETLRLLDAELYLSTKVRKYVLLRLDEVLADTSGVVYDHPTITVEHVLPQNPKQDSRWLEVFDEEQRTRWTHRLANLVLLNRRKNSEAQNYDFDKKKEKYFLGKKGVVTFALTSQVLGCPEWTPQVLEERQARLLGELAAEWRLR